jgi:hypothetical protein
VRKIYVPAVMIMVMIIAAPITKIAGEFDVCAEGKTKMFNGFDDVRVPNHLA